MSRNPIQDNFVTLFNRMNVERLLPYLRQERMITNDQYKMLASPRVSTSAKKKRLLLWLPRKGNNYFVNFGKCLVWSGQTELARHIGVDVAMVPEPPVQLPIHPSSSQPASTTASGVHVPSSVASLPSANTGPHATGQVAQPMSSHPNHGPDSHIQESAPYLEGKDWVKWKLIGDGAFGTCFLARDVKNGTLFAVKQACYRCTIQKEEDEKLSQQMQEVSMLRHLNHPNIIRYLGVTRRDGCISIFLEWMAGGSLDKLLVECGRFSETVTCDYTRQISSGIVYLHENGIIHRDLKGGNILVDSTGQRIRIADFGSAARLATNTTGVGEFLTMEGTIPFLAPEVVNVPKDELGTYIGYGRKSDVWSIGCVVIQMLTAKPPWAGTHDKKNKFQFIYMIGSTEVPPPMPEINDPSLKDFTIRCLEIKPEDRPTSAELLRHPLFTGSYSHAVS